jgi:hypothetical protein
MKDDKKLTIASDTDALEVAERLKRFEEFTASFRQAVEESGLTEEMLLEQMREIRRELYEERYGINPRKLRDAK